MVISSWTFKIRVRGLCYPVVKWWCVNPASRSNLSLNCCCWITISLLHLLRARSRWHPNLLYLRRGPVGANAGGSGHAGEARGDAGWVSRSAVPHGWSPDGRNKSRVWRSESHKPRPVALCVLVLISNGMTHGARWDRRYKKGQLMFDVALMRIGKADGWSACSLAVIHCYLNFAALVFWLPPCWFIQRTVFVR